VIQLRLIGASMWRRHSAEEEMKMTSFQKARTITSALIALGFIALGHEAHALSVSGAKGYATDPSKQLFCFAVGHQIQNFCDEAESVTIPLSVNAGNHTVRIYGVNYQGNGLSCILCDTTQSGSIVNCNNVPAFPVGGSAQTAGVSTPSSGALVVMCSLGLGSEIDTVNYNP
jgi:hypothetical protein